MGERKIFLSVATTGFSIEDGDRIIEIACAEMIDGQLTDNSFHSYLNPECNSHEDALATHGIPDEFLKDKPKFAEQVRELLSYLTGAELVVHDAGVHLGFLDKELERMEKPGIAVCSRGIVDTLVLANKEFPGKSNSLEAVCDRLGLETPPSHISGAMVDAELTADVYVALMHE